MKDFADVWNQILLSGTVAPDGRRLAVITFTRGGESRSVDVYPELAGTDAIRTIGIGPRRELIAHEIQPNTPAAQAGLQPGDHILAINGRTLYQMKELISFLQINKDAEVSLTIQRGTENLHVAMKPRLQTVAGNSVYQIGIVWRINTVLVYKTPIEQFGDVFENIGRTFSTLANRNSDIGVRHMSSIVGIVDNLQMAAAAGIAPAFALLIMINLSLAIFNLLPIPVLDGGHVALATYAKLRGRAISPVWVQNSVKVCFLLLISLILYVSYFDIRRVVLSHTREEPAATAPAPDKSEK
jgi:regulator of sigma E protease